MSKQNVLNIVIVVGVVAVVVGVAGYKASQSEPAPVESATGTTTPAESASDVPEAKPQALPRMVDLGAHECIPCKKMAPILKELMTEYAGRATIEFIDVHKNEQAAEKYGVTLIPTQIFYDRERKEVWRHVGFLSKEEIVAKLAELGVK